MVAPTMQKSCRRPFCHTGYILWHMMALRHKSFTKSNGEGAA